MNDGPPVVNKSWFEKLGQVFSLEPKDKNELVEILRDAASRSLLDSNSLGMIEGVMQISQMRVRDIMLPRSQMVVIEKNMTLEEIVPLLIKTTHSRFPVIGEHKDEVIGIILAKDLLKFGFNSNVTFELTYVCRPVVFVPESKRLDVLLQEFRQTRNHMAIVVDEFGGVTGLITIEDILEQIVGDIEDEYDTHPSHDIKVLKDNIVAVKATTPINDFNAYFNTNFDEKGVETIGGLVVKKFGRLPTKGESVTLGRLNCQVMRADRRRIHLLHISFLR